MNLEQLKAAAQAVVDAQDATTHAIIAPSAEAFDEIVEKRKLALTQAVYQLKQVLKAAQEWRGMESAPKGTFVLVIDSEYGDHSGAFVARYTEAFSGSWLINTSHVPHVVYPTHWQPLPTPPQEQ